MKPWGREEMQVKDMPKPLSVQAWNGYKAISRIFAASKEKFI